MDPPLYGAIKGLCRIVHRLVSSARLGDLNSVFICPRGSLARLIEAGLLASASQPDEAVVAIGDVLRSSAKLLKIARCLSAELGTVNDHNGRFLAAANYPAV